MTGTDADLRQSVVEMSLDGGKLGRPRDGSRDTAILNAALDLLSTVGYERVSMDAVAARAHASKATIYRRWDSKATLIAAAVQCRQPMTMTFPDTGSLRSDLTAAVEMIAAGMTGQDLGLLTGLLAGMRADPELAEILRNGMFKEKEAAIATLFGRAAGRGEFVDELASELFQEVTFAVILHRLLLVGMPSDDAFVEHVVDKLLIPILTRPLTTS